MKKLIERVGDLAHRMKTNDTIYVEDQKTMAEAITALQRFDAALAEYDQLCIKAIPAHKIELIRELEQIRKARAGK